VKVRKVAAIIRRKVSENEKGSAIELYNVILCHPNTVHVGSLSG
jgi:hypothetical protein